MKNAEHKFSIFYQGKNIKKQRGALFYTEQNLLPAGKIKVKNTMAHITLRDKKNYLPRLPPSSDVETLLVLREGKICSSHQQIPEPVRGATRKTTTE